MLGLLGLLTVVGLLALQSKSTADGITAANNHRRVNGPNTPSSAKHSEQAQHNGQSVSNTAPIMFDLAVSSRQGAQDNVLQDGPATDAQLRAELKEKTIRERFGVIKRAGKWIPTIAGGTNLVYITTGSLLPGLVGEPYDLRFLATSGFPPYLWTVVEGELPRSFSFDRHSGQLSGIPGEATSTKLLIEVTDSRGGKDMAEYRLIIQPKLNLAIITEWLPPAFPGGEYHFQLQATGGVPPYAWSAAGSLDEIGLLAFDPHTGVIEGQIAASATQTDIPLIFGVEDKQLSVFKEFLLHVRTGLSILNIPQSPVYEAEWFEFAFRATGGMEPYCWGVCGELPPGLELSATGILAGQPSDAGLYSIGIWVADAAEQVQTRQFALEILPEVPLAVSDFTAFLSRNSIALQWRLPLSNDNLQTRIVRGTGAMPLTPAEGTTIYLGAETTCLDRDLGAGNYWYTAFLERNGMLITSAPPPKLEATLPPKTDPFADRLVNHTLLHPEAFRSSELPQIVLGPPRGRGLAWGSTDVVSLGAAVNDDGGASAPYGGMITLEFADNLVWNGPGADFTVFENVFYICDASGTPDPETRFMEPAIISVSQDGLNWRQFGIDFSPRYHPDSRKLNLRHPYCYNSGFAGVNPVMSDGYDPDPTDPEVSGGDSFDLADVGLSWIRYVRIQSTGNRWIVDDDSDLVHHNEEFSAAIRSCNKSGFDLDAVTAIWMERILARD